MVLPIPYKRAKRLLVKGHVEQALHAGPIQMLSYLHDVLTLAESQLGIKKKRDETDEEFLVRMAKELELPVPDSSQVKEP